MKMPALFQSRYQQVHSVVRLRGPAHTGPVLEVRRGWRWGPVSRRLSPLEGAIRFAPAAANLKPRPLPIHTLIAVCRLRRLLRLLEGAYKWEPNTSATSQQAIRLGRFTQKLRFASDALLRRGLSAAAAATSAAS
jgi:hypothetical protein